MIELIVYISILMLTLIVVMMSISSFARVYRRVGASQTLARSGAIAMERMVREIRNAQSVDQAASTIGTHPGRLTLITPVSSGVTRRSEFSVASSSIRLAEDGVVKGTLTDSSAVVDSLVFNLIDTTYSDAVRITLVLSVGTGTSSVSATFQDTAVLRGSYAL